MIPIEHQGKVFTDVLDIMWEKLSQYNIHVSNKLSTAEIITTMSSLRDHVYLNENIDVWNKLSKKVIKKVEKSFWKWKVISRNIKNFLYD